MNIRYYNLLVSYVRVPKMFLGISLILNIIDLFSS